MITVNTKLVNLLGNPVSQSYSYIIHNAAFQAMGLDAYYYPIETTKEHLGDIVNGLRYMNTAGFSVTKPFKRDILAYLDAIDDFAAKVGAVNTVVNKEGKFTGYNTDGDGCVDAIEKASGLKLPDTTVLCLGAGGSASATCSTLAYRGVKKIIVATRKPAKAEAFVENIAHSFPGCQLATCDLHQENVLIQTAEECQIIMNHTGVGMIPYLGQTPVSKKIFKPYHFVVDSVYNPGETRFLQEAREAGCVTQNGIGMFLGQGVLQIKHWFHQEPPLVVMEKALAEIIAATNVKNR